MRKWFALGFCLFVVTLAAVAGFRLARESLAVIMGVVFGVAASIPTSLLIVAITRRSETRQMSNYPYPPVVIINPGGEKQHFLPPVSSMPTVLDSSPRQFRVIGEEEESWEDRFFD